MTRSLLLLLALALAPSLFAADDDPLAAWRKNVKITPVSPDAAGHTMHSYFNTCPESPDGKYVLFFASSAKNGETGEVRIRERATGKETVLAPDLHVEDAHRVACQQWLSNGRRVSFHSERDGEWSTTVVDLETGKARELAKDRLSGWGQPDADLLPLYGPHWKAGPHRDLEIANVETGEIRTYVRADDVKVDWLQKALNGRSASIFFPILSPDRSRIFWKMAIPGTTGDPRGKAASDRLGLVCYSLAEQRFLYTNPSWGHPSWQPGSRTVTETSFRLFDSNDGKMTRLPGLPSPRGDHPSASPDSKLIVTDTTMDVLQGDAKNWGIIVADARGNQYVLLHQFDNSGGATSWRRSHPHPVFSRDGKRIYFNVSSGAWTRLFVAERE